MDYNISTLVQQEVEFQPKDRIHDITPTIALLQAQHLNYGFIMILGIIFQKAASERCFCSLVAMKCPAIFEL